MNHQHFSNNMDHPHDGYGGTSYDHGYFGGPTHPSIPGPPPLQQSYYAHSATRPPLLDTTSSSEDSPYHDHRHHHPHYHQGPPPPSLQSSYACLQTHSDTQSSSFESHGSSPGGVPPFVGFAYPGDSIQYAGSYHPMMGPPPPLPAPPGYPHYYAWAVPPVEYVTNIEPTDVLSGRGGATNTHSGNKAFRALVKSFQERYLKAKKRDKPSVAVEVVEIIRKKGGRFLRRCDVPGPRGEAYYFDIGDRRATEKVCQCLREGAPQIRAKRRAKGKGFFTSSSSEDDDAKLFNSPERTPSEEKEATFSSASSSFERTGDEKEGTQNDSERTGSIPHSSRSEPMYVRPSARLMRRKEVEPLSAEDLSPDEREMYLRDFFPPDSSTVDFQHDEMKPPATLNPKLYQPAEYAASVGTS